MFRFMRIGEIVSTFVLLVTSMGAAAACMDSVVLVHGNTGDPSDWDNTYQGLLDEGYSPSQVYRPDWGSKTCAACNDHSGSELTPVVEALNDAVANSCTGKVDVIGHSMGVTLAAKAIISEGQVNKVDAFVGIAGAYRGLWSCGVYPFNVFNSTCGTNGLSVSSPLLDWLYGQDIATRVYSIKSWVDQIVCSTGTCLVNGVHSSRIPGENATYSYNYGHFGLQKYTSSLQLSLIK